MNLSVAVKIPEVGESISEVAIGEWLKHEGDFVERDEDVVVIETDKATVEIPARKPAESSALKTPATQRR
jgi:2-oxoglutarate dehydrogenase E2 component (dihydrolipoamide succinyltransferase)